MSAQIARNLDSAGLSTAHSSSQPRNGRDQEHNDGATPWGESPDLLRWRADMLMDEMMLGAIDVYAGEPKVAPVPMVAPIHPSPAGPHTLGKPTHLATDQSFPTPAVQENGKNGTHHKPEAPVNNNARVYSSPANGSSDRQVHHAASSTQASESTTYENGKVNYSRPSAPEQPATGQPHNREPKAWVFSAEARYQQIARNQQMSTPDESPANFTSSIPVPTPAPRWMPEELAGSPAHHPESSGGVGNSARSPELGPVRRTVAQVTSAMATPATSAPIYGGTNLGGAATGGQNRNGKWSNLLPRMSNTDVQTLQQEITTLHSEINALLPSGHESNQRAQHLLEKAQAILESDPTRSAEVEYYLQQVRTIFQRVQQTIHWSNLYRNRLMLYLAGWSLLALIVLVARYLYQAQIEGLVVDLGHWATDSFATQNFVTWLSTVAAGTLGGAVGALISLRSRSRLEHGFFDRKYSLRGLILPIMGALFGLMLYLLVAPLFYLLTIDPSVNLAVSTTPALLSFAFGVGQESIYGTRS